MTRTDYFNDPHTPKANSIFPAAQRSLSIMNEYDTTSKNNIHALIGNLYHHLSLLKTHIVVSDTRSAEIVIQRNALGDLLF